MPTQTLVTPLRLIAMLVAAALLVILGPGGRTALGQDSVWTVGETGLQVQNVDPSSEAEIRARFFDFDGRLTHDLRRNVRPG